MFEREKRRDGGGGGGRRGRVGKRRRASLVVERIHRILWWGPFVWGEILWLAWSVWSLYCFTLSDFPLFCRFLPNSRPVQLVVFIGMAQRTGDAAITVFCDQRRVQPGGATILFLNFENYFYILILIKKIISSKNQ